jgi:hypothetical protein
MMRDGPSYLQGYNAHATTFAPACGCSTNPPAGAARLLPRFGLGTGIYSWGVVDDGVLSLHVLVVSDRFGVEDVYGHALEVTATSRSATPYPHL